MDTLKRDKFKKGRKGQKGRVSTHDITFRRNAAKQYNEGNQSFLQVSAQLGITSRQLNYWVKEFSTDIAPETTNIPMLNEEQESKDYTVLKSENIVLKKQLSNVELKNFALETMIDLANAQLGIDIRKNGGAKQPKE